MRAFVAAAVLALVLVASPGAAPPPTLTPGVLTVGVALPSDGFEVGIVKGSQVIYAQGFDIDLARALSKQLELDKAVFVQSRFDRLFSSGSKPWDVAIAQITRAAASTPPPAMARTRGSRFPIGSERTQSIAFCSGRRRRTAANATQNASTFLLSGRRTHHGSGGPRALQR